MCHKAICTACPNCLLLYLTCLSHLTLFYAENISWWDCGHHFPQRHGLPLARMNSALMSLMWRRDARFIRQMQAWPELSLTFSR